MKVMIDSTVRKALEEVVGPENVSTDPAILDTYAFQWCGELENLKKGREPSRFLDRPEAVVLPSNTEEIQAIVRICNRFKLKFKAHSTGLGPWAAVSGPGVILMDLRRMNRIIKIDEKNMYAIIEPYVTGAQLQAEVMKKGLNCHMPGAGPNVSPLASSTSLGGIGFTSVYTGYSPRNLLAVEWVLPSGEILRLGSLSTNSGWFSGDGPGPSLRGIMRGYMGAMGGLGVFTKCAVKLYPWPSSASWEIEGVSPNYEFCVPKWWRLYIINYPDWENCENALYRIAEAEVGVMVMRESGTPSLAVTFSHSIEEMANLIFSLGTIVKKYIVVLIAANSQREFDYQTKVMEEIIRKTGGEDLVSTGVFKPPSISYAEAIRNMLGQHAFIATSSFQSTFGMADTIRAALSVAGAAEKIKLKYIDKGVIADDGGEASWGSFIEHGHFMHMETPTVYDVTKSESCKGMVDYMNECYERNLEDNLGIPFFVVGDREHERWGPRCSNYHLWLRKIKEAFDPNNISDSGWYISPGSKKSSSTKEV
jgi:glycolate oxidase